MPNAEREFRAVYTGVANTLTQMAGDKYQLPLHVSYRVCVRWLLLTIIGIIHTLVLGLRTLVAAIRYRRSMRETKVLRAWSFTVKKLHRNSISSQNAKILWNILRLDDAAYCGLWIRVSNLLRVIKPGSRWLWLTTAYKNWLIVLTPCCMTYPERPDKLPCYYK